MSVVLRGTNVGLSLPVETAEAAAASGSCTSLCAPYPPINAEAMKSSVLVRLLTTFADTGAPDTGGGRTASNLATDDLKLDDRPGEDRMVEGTSYAPARTDTARASCDGSGRGCTVWGGHIPGGGASDTGKAFRGLGVVCGPLDARPMRSVEPVVSY